MSEEGKTRARDKVICPGCGHETEPSGDDGQFYDEDSCFEWDCDECGTDFDIHVSPPSWWYTATIKQPTEDE